MYRIGVDLGGTNIAIGIMDHHFKLIKKGSTPTPAMDAEAIADTIASFSKKLADDAGIPFSEIDSLGVATPGIVNRTTGEIVYANNIQFRHFPMAGKLKEKLPLREIYLENDANAAALGEAKAGAARGAVNSVMITLGTGVGGGIIIGGDVYMGFNCAAGELGHIVIEKDGYPCSCGRRGCWESYSSATGLIRMTREKMESAPNSIMHELAEKEGKVSGRTAFDAARKGDLAAEEVVDAYLSYLACGIASMINIFHPETVVIGGGVSNEGENLLRPLIPKVFAEACGDGDDSNMTKIRIAELGNDAGIIGAACLGL